MKSILMFMIVAMTSGTALSKGLVTDLDEAPLSDSAPSLFTAAPLTTPKMELATIAVNDCRIKISNVDLVKGDDNMLYATLSLINTAAHTEHGSQSVEQRTAINSDLFNLIDGTKIQLISAGKICSEWRRPVGAVMGGPTWITNDDTCKFSFKTEKSQKMESGRSIEICALKLFIE